jgi:hypothetical protein
VAARSSTHRDLVPQDEELDILVEVSAAVSRASLRTCRKITCCNRSDTTTIMPSLPLAADRRWSAGRAMI